MFYNTQWAAKLLLLFQTTKQNVSFFVFFVSFCKIRDIAEVRFCFPQTLRWRNGRGRLR